MILSNQINDKLRCNNMNYLGIISHFNSRGLTQQSLLTFEDLQQILNESIRNSTMQAVHIFNHQIVEELWGECQKNVNGQIEVGQFATVLLQAKEILEHRIQQTQDKIRVKSQERQQVESQIVQARGAGNVAQSDRLRQVLQDLELELDMLNEDKRNYDTDFKVITIPFQRVGGITGRNTLSPDEARNINGRLDGSRRMQSQFFMKRSSAALSLMFFLSVFLLLIEMAITLQKHHYLGILTTLAILAIFALNYFNQTYINVVLGMLSVSIISDVIWLVFQFGSYWSPGLLSTLPTLYPGLLKLILLGVIIAAFIKVILLLILLSYRNVQEQGTINGCCCQITVFPQSGPFGRQERPDSFFDPRMF